MNYFSQEIICGDDKGNISFTKIFNKIQTSVRPTKERILFLKNVEMFKDVEHLVCLTESSLTLSRIKRETKVINKKYHDAEVIKLFAIEPISKDGAIVEDAKIISASYDNTIKIWDFLSMQCINQIKSPNLEFKNSEISTICHLQRNNIIAVGLDIGKLYFFDLNKSKYMKTDYESKFVHASYLTCIINRQTTKDKEYLLTTGYDAKVAIYDIEEIVMKHGKNKFKQDMDEEEKQTRFIFNNSNEIGFLNPKLLNKLSAKEFSDLSKRYLKELQEKPMTAKKEEEARKLKNYIPNLKFLFDCKASLKKERNYENYCLEFKEIDKKTSYVYAGGADCNIDIFCLETGNYVSSLEGHKGSVISLLFDGNYLLSGSSDGTVKVWNCLTNEELFQMGDVDLTMSNSRVLTRSA